MKIDYNSTQMTQIKWIYHDGPASLIAVVRCLIAVV